MNEENISTDIGLDFEIIKEDGVVTGLNRMIRSTRNIVRTGDVIPEFDDIMDDK